MAKTDFQPTINKGLSQKTSTETGLNLPAAPKEQQLEISREQFLTAARIKIAPPNPESRELGGKTSFAAMNFKEGSSVYGPGPGNSTPVIPKFPEVRKLVLQNLGPNDPAS